MIIGSDAVQGIELLDGRRIGSKAVVITAGTFLNGLIHVGNRSYPGGRMGEAPAVLLGQYFREIGFAVGRLKTGTPPRLDYILPEGTNAETELRECGIARVPPGPRSHSEKNEPER